ncbi:MAG: hypothetical protein ACRD3W_09135 [Terriglobales bacterium]
MADRSIGGYWRGHYDYKKLPDEGSGFEALFIEEGNALSGHIIDDCPPGTTTGKASISGMFQFPSVSFIKTYSTPGYAPIEYDGQMSDDGKTISGTWAIFEGKGVYQGRWEAYRLGEEEKKSETTAEKTKLVGVDQTR